ncbi:hypothetical protein QR692_10345 [Lactococcus petauri]|uniref:hypothetical protein n=1 Tax=Lactococcus petauri TaxID=1940789 RepID=UPI00207904BD|nr:hypothetical protein [Lactococcus petauri]USI65383.1 hypothetical protein LMK05_11230 [Lactococcus petauri]USI67878.1 hypothetical protein LMK04_10465 [Lactococcus petauri]WJE12539.1 hypothetical protein QR692_10345 [Lactococcus petauri]
MKYIVANHLKDRDSRPRLWRIPEPLINYPIVPRQTKALVHTRLGLKHVQVLKVIERDSLTVFDRKSKKEVEVSQEVERFYE